MSASNGNLVLAVPSKGRLMDQTAKVFADAGLVLKKSGPERGYRGLIEGLDGVEVAFLSAADIARTLRDGEAHAGVTGADLVHENIPDLQAKVEIRRPLGFGHADVVLAVPMSWIDVETVGDLESMALAYRRAHGRRPRVATKYLDMTRRFLGANGVTGFLIVESLGATEGTPAAGSAEIIVDITTTGATLAANQLKVLDDGIMLSSQASLVVSRTAAWSPSARAALAEIERRLDAIGPRP
jgi:ATP phosphoribosyltransferase